VSGKALADMGDDQFLAVFTPPDALTGALAEIANGYLVEFVGPGAALTGKQGSYVELDMSKVSPEQLMAASNVGRRRLGLAQFPDLTSFDRYQQLRRPKEDPR
jgi:hypothetical protein